MPRPHPVNHSKTVGFQASPTVIAAIVGYLLIYLVWLKFGGGSNRELIGDLAFVPLTAAAAYLCLRAGRRAAAVPGVRWAWRLIALALISYGIGDILQCIYELSSAEYPSPSFADLFFLAFYPLFLLGMMKFPWERTAGSAERVQATLDAITIAIGGGAVVWYVVLGPSAYSDSGSLAANLVAAGYLFGDLILIAALARLWMARGDQRIRTPLALIALGLGAYVIADVAYSSAVLNSEYAGGSWIDSLWMFATAAFAFAALAQPRLDSRSGRISERDGGVLSVAAGALPYVAAAAVYALLLSTNTGEPFFPDVSLALTAAAVGGLLLLREYLARRRLAQAHTTLAALATTDPLTGLPNHRGLVEAIDRELDRGIRFERDCSLLFVDVDRFKTLNDRYGHVAGDVVLGELGEVMKDTLRPLDTVGRWGGEEFVAVLPEADPDQAMRIAERLRSAIASHSFDVASGIHLTVSVGVADYPRDGSGRAPLLDVADRAMHSAKRMGHNQVFSADDPIVAALQEADRVDSDLEEQLAVGATDALTLLVENRDSGTGAHGARVATLSEAVARAMGCPPEQVQAIQVAAQLHDIGKVAVPDAILRKAGRLTDEEWEQMRQHPTIGADVVSRMGRLAELAPVVRSHHEHYDGSGYPAGLAGEEIPLEARIIGAVDAFDAMTSDRPYRDAMAVKDARDELRRGAGSQFDPLVIEALDPILGRISSEEQRETQPVDPPDLGLLLR